VSGASGAPLKVLGVITARGGSKGIPGKNLKPLAGKPLLAYTVDCARDAGVFDRVILSTDDDAIAEYARRLGCEVPFMRPAPLAQDETPHLPVMQHAVQSLMDADGYDADVVVILQPTSPLRRPEDIRTAVTLLASTDADSALSVSEVPAHFHPLRMLRVDADRRAVLYFSGEPVAQRVNRRQDMAPAWVMNGAVYAFRPQVLAAAEPSLYGQRTVAFAMPEPFGLSIDTPEDWAHAEDAVRHHHGS
jgi:CMP-N-acetylneuraminic acid synthetase